MKQLDDCYFDFVDLRISRFWLVFSGSMDAVGSNESYSIKDMASLSRKQSFFSRNYIV